MKPATQEWIEKAEGDYRTALRERRVRRHPNHDAVCFHAQQCIEKYLNWLDRKDTGILTLRCYKTCPHVLGMRGWLSYIG